MNIKYQYTHFSKINEAINKWVLEQRHNGIDLTELAVREKAVQINKDLNGDPKFAASQGWYSRWKKNNLNFNQINDTCNLNTSKTSMQNPTTLFVEPFYSGSHKQLIDTLINEFEEKSELISLPGKKWPWRARCSALTLSQIIPHRESYKILFCSSVLSLSELLGLRPDLQKLRKIVYFHENQLTYPKKQIKQRDVQYGYNQITTSLAADHIIFNSNYNMNSFLFNIDTFLKIMPDCRPKELLNEIKTKSSVIYGPIEFLKISINPKLYKNYNTLHVIWPHRWEFDKNPEDFFSILLRLKSENLNFKVSVLGESFSEKPEIFTTAKKSLKNEIVNWAYVDSKEEYYKVLCSGNVVISTAYHEFYGVAMLEAVYCGCFPLVPNRLVYPEIFNEENIYQDNNELYSRLKNYCCNPQMIENDYLKMSPDLGKFDVDTVMKYFKKIFL